MSEHGFEQLLGDDNSLEYPYSTPGYSSEEIDRAFEKGVVFTSFAIVREGGKTIDYEVSVDSMVDRIRVNYFLITGEPSWAQWPQVIEDSALLTTEEFTDRYIGWL